MSKTKRNMSFVALLGMGVLAANVAQAEPEVSFGGQYRVNSYTLNDAGGGNSVAAARARIRQNVDIKFSDAFDTHLQLNIGHITQGIGNHTTNPTGTASPGNDTVGLRHAVMNYHFSDAATLTAGLVPLSDKFGDTLFSGDWDFNPVTFALHGNYAGMNYRAGWFKILEGTEGVAIKNDITGALLDVGSNMGSVNAGAMGLVLRTANAAADGYDNSAWIGGRVATDINGIALGADVVYASVKKNAQNVKTANDAKGTQVRLTASGKVDALSWSLLGLLTTGKKAGEGYISPQKIYGGQGYWGKTGVLNIQGPTDTGMDANMLRAGNDGYGLRSVQAGLGYGFSSDWSGYLGAGYYSADKERVTGQGKNIGADVYAQVKYAFPDSPLTLEVFVDYADLGVAHFNSGGKSRTVTAVGSRLQAEF